MYRYKTLFGEKLSARNSLNQETEAQINCKLLNAVAVQKCQILELQPLKNALSQSLGGESAKASSRITDFGTSSVYCDLGMPASYKVSWGAAYVSGGILPLQQSPMIAAY
jgi:hypothetical protein